MTLEQVMDIVCKKRMLAENDYFFDFYQGDHSAKGASLKKMDQSIGDLGIGRLQLVESKSSPTPELPQLRLSVEKLKSTHKRSPSGAMSKSGASTTPRERGASISVVNVASSLLPGAKKSKEDISLSPVTKRVNPVYFYTPQSAVKYQEFNVIKVNKFGVKQERIMGIDINRLTNQKKEGIKNTSSKTKR